MVLSRPELLKRLANDDLQLRGYLPNASNHTLLVDVGDPGEGIAAIYKPREGERPLGDFPEGTLCRREVAAYEVSEALGWEIVPPTVLRADAPLGEGSVQLFVPHDPSRHYFVLVEEGRSRSALARMATFDLLVNNADRKGSHVLEVHGSTRIVGIDHGLTFHPQPKLRTVIWDLGDEEIVPRWRDDVAGIERELLGGGELASRLERLLSPLEVLALRARSSALAERSRLPAPPTDRRPYPWPPL